MKIVLIILIFFTSLCSNELVLTKKQKDYLLNKKVITVHNETNWAPYNFNEKGTPKGFMVDYMKLIAKKLHVRVKYINGYSWNEFLNMLKTEKLDVIINIANTKERAKYINFTKPFIESKKAIFSNIKRFKKLSDLNGKVVAIPRGFYMEDFLKKHYPKIKVRLYKNIEECLYAIINKEADALIENYAVVNYQIIKNGLAIKYVEINNNKELNTDICFGVRKSQKILGDILQKAQDSVSKKELDKLKNKWFGIDAFRKNHRDNGSISLSKSQKEYLKHKKYIRMCVDPDWMPFEKIDKDGNYIGIMSDYSKLFSNMLGVEFKLEPTKNFKQSLEMLKKGTCDIIMADVATQDRKELFLATKPYFISPRAYVTRNDTPWVSDFSYLLAKNHKIGVLIESPVVRILKKRYANIKLVKFNTTREGLKAVSDRKITAFVSIMPNLAYTIQKNMFTNIRISGYIKSEVKLSVLINKKEKKLLPILNQAIDNITEKERLDIFSRWIKVEFKNGEKYKYLWVVVGVIMFLLAIIGYANLLLNKRVEIEVEKNKQQQLLMLQQSRLAQMGEIINMIAHQWRQPLNALFMLNQTAVLKYKKDMVDGKFVEYFEKNSKKQIDNMSKTIDDFRNFFKPQKRKTEFMVNSAILSVIDMIQLVFDRYKINIVYKQKDVVKMTGYPNELGQAILNILNNAKDALVESGTKEKKIVITLQKTDEKVVIEISDNAGGIKESAMDRIFDPYFSTKEDKNGTGLGLYMTKLIIEDHMGGVLMASNSSVGAVFTMTFG